MPRPPFRKAGARSAPAAKRAGYDRLVAAIETVTREMVGRAAAAVNQALVVRNWVVGAYIVEYEQGGSDRARYGARLLERLAEDLAARGIKGLDRRGLRDCRSLYHLYPQIRGSVAPEFESTVVEFATAGMDNRLFVSRYLAALPSAEQLKALVERDRARLEAPK